jgi:hypothetical protein
MATIVAKIVMRQWELEMERANVRLKAELYDAIKAQEVRWKEVTETAVRTLRDQSTPTQ